MSFLECAAWLRCALHSSVRRLGEPEQLAAERQLNPVFLKRWVEYLRQAGQAPAAAALAQLVNDPQGPFALPQKSCS